MKPTRYVFLLFLACVLMQTDLYSQTTVSIVASKDNTLYETASGNVSNGKGIYVFAGRVSGSGEGLRRRAVLQFDLTGQVPEGAQITSASLTMNLSKGNGGTQTIRVHRMLADWGEGTSNASGEEGTGAAATTNDATWLHAFFNTTNWSTNGGDFLPDASASLTANNLGSYTWNSTGDLVADVQSWVDDPTRNFGWIIIGNETSQTTAKRFDSREHTNAANRPTLSITFTSTTAVHDLPGVPAAIQLAQNYPNPFNPGTLIRYSLNQSSGEQSVSLAIFNVLGQRIRSLVSGVQGAGEHSIEWDGRFDGGELAPSGVYLYRLQVGEFVETRKMTLLR